MLDDLLYGGREAVYNILCRGLVVLYDIIAGCDDVVLDNIYMGHGCTMIYNMGSRMCYIIYYKRAGIYYMIYCMAACLYNIKHKHGGNDALYEKECVDKGVLYDIL